MHLIKADGGVGEIVAWTLVPGTSVMYNLEVQQDHTFTVGDGSWVVHNSGCSGFETAKKLSKHFTKHNHEFDVPFANADDYEKAVIKFMSGDTVADSVHQASISKPGQFYGDLVRYDASTNTLGVKAANGVLRTMYRPIEGIEEFYHTLR